MTRRILLVSSSTCHPTAYLDHAEDEIRRAFGPIGRVLFLPWALFDRDAYAEKVRERLGRMGYELESAHRTPSPARAIEEAEAVFVGGGNTFRLLKHLEELDLFEPIRRRVGGGMPYVGSSAGSNVAGVTIGTTNDMPIVRPRSFSGLGLVPFNINPHYRNPDPASTHKGETRDQRIAQFLEENEIPVLALREGAMVRVEGPTATIQGRAGGRLFRRGMPILELAAGDRIDRLVAPNNISNS